MHDEQPVVALVVAQPGALRDGLAALLTAITRVGWVQVTDQVETALQWLAKEGRAVVLADAACLRLIAPVDATLAQMRQACPAAWIALLIDTGAEQEAYQNTAANLVALKGYPAARLSGLIEAHLQRTSQ